jgi:hypothetical protein
MTTSAPVRSDDTRAPGAPHRAARAPDRPSPEARRLPALRTSPRSLGGADQRRWLAVQGAWLQSAAGNRAVAQLVRSTSSSSTATPTDGATVQRCGGADPATCPCHADGESADIAGGDQRPTAQRQLAGSAVATVQRALSVELAESISRKLENAMSGWGTDEDAIYGALSGRTAADMVEIRRAYRRLFDDDLDEELADELTSSELARVSQMMAPVEDETALPAEQAEELRVGRARVIATQLRDAMAGLGTEEDQIFGALVGRSHDEIGEIKRQYLELTGRYLERDLQDELSGEDLRRALNLIDVVGEFETTGFTECTPDIREKIRQFVPTARAQVQKAITALEPGWERLDESTKADFRRFFDPGNSGQIDARFVRLVQDNFRQIQAYMAEGLDFDCELASGSICGDGYKWCGEGDGNGRLYWTCFGALHVCANAGWMRASDERRWSDIIHESTHNALHTTDRAYCDTDSWPGLTPYGTGAVSVLDEIPVVGFIFKLAGGGGDTLNNPDSYSHFAQER